MGVIEGVTLELLAPAMYHCLQAYLLLCGSSTHSSSTFLVEYFCDKERFAVPLYQNTCNVHCVPL